MAAMARAVTIPVTVKMRAGWTAREIVAPDFARAMQDAGAAAVTVHGRTAEQSYGGSADWGLIARVARAVTIPVFGNGDLLEADRVVRRWRDTGVAGVLVGRGVVRNPWLLAQAADLAQGLPARSVTGTDRAAFLSAYIDLLLAGPDAAEPEGFRHEAPRAARGRREASTRATAAARGRERWVINKLRALAAWYTRGLQGGSRVRAAVNRAESIGQLRESLARFFGDSPDIVLAAGGVSDAHL